MSPPAEASAASARAAHPGLWIVMFGGPDDWTGTWYSRHQLSVGLARRHSVVLVEEPIGWRAALTRPRSWANARLAAEPAGTLRYSHPGWLPRVYRNRLVRRELDRLRSQVLSRCLRAAGTGRPIAYVWHPEQLEAVEPLSSWPLVYHAYDRYDRYTGASEADGLARESWLARRASVCIGASSRLAEHLQSLGARDVRVLRHGIDFAFFASPRPLPDALARIPRPRLGLVSSLSDAVDYRALIQVARARPDWSLVILGNETFNSAQKRSDFAALQKLANVHWMGFAPREDVPAWISGLDVALTCYDLATWAPFNQPLKLYEYLACGVPVVCSDIQATQELGDLVLRVAAQDRWVPAIEAALSSDTADLRERRRAFARANTWERRIDDLERVLAPLARATPEPGARAPVPS